MRRSKEAVSRARLCVVRSWTAPVSRAAAPAAAAETITAVNRFHAAALAHRSISISSPTAALGGRERALGRDARVRRWFATGGEARATHGGEAAAAAAEAPPDTSGAESGPAALYHARYSGRDANQLRVLAKLQRLYTDLTSTSSPASSSSAVGGGLNIVEPSSGGGSAVGSIWAMLTSAPASEPVRAPQGLYLYGGVGCGKTMLMDLLYEALPPSVSKFREHFHGFMLDVHARLRAKEKAQDPLAAVALELVSSARAGDPSSSSPVLLCLDEFMVTDVADAMILNRLFAALWEHGVVLVATSNRAPASLYERGLQRELFLPFIANLEGRCDAHQLRSPTDYRMLAKRLREPLLFWGDGADEQVRLSFRALAGVGEGEEPAEVVEGAKIEVMMGRELEVPLSAGPLALFKFDALCGKPLSAADYIALTERFHTVAIEHVPIFLPKDVPAAYRFVTLIDEVYERRVRLILSMEGSPAELFQHVVTQSEKAERRDDPHLVVDDNLGFTKDRVVSRLMEMQSLVYARAHAEMRAPELLDMLPSEDDGKEGAEEEAAEAEEEETQRKSRAA